MGCQQVINCLEPLGVDLIVGLAAGLVSGLIVWKITSGWDKERNLEMRFNQEKQDLLQHMQRCNEYVRCCQSSEKAFLELTDLVSCVPSRFVFQRQYAYREYDEIFTEIGIAIKALEAYTSEDYTPDTARLISTVQHAYIGCAKIRFARKKDRAPIFFRFRQRVRHVFGRGESND